MPIFLNYFHYVSPKLKLKFPIQLKKILQCRRCKEYVTHLVTAITLLAEFALVSTTSQLQALNIVALRLNALCVVEITQSTLKVVKRT